MNVEIIAVAGNTLKVIEVELLSLQAEALSLVMVRSSEILIEGRYVGTSRGTPSILIFGPFN